MRKISDYILMAALCFSTIGCTNNELDPDASGTEVSFGLALESPDTKTIYGPESGNAFPIYWSEGDKILVASPQCVSGRDRAEYLVTPVARQNYAEAITKTGDYGVQWGNSNADFYSIYPAAGASWQTLEANNVTAKLNISAQQSANLVYDENNHIYNAADMNNVIMYARTGNVENGKTVNLKYTPYSTVIEFDMGIKQVGNTFGSVKVMSMTLQAPEGTAISGDFTLKFNDNEPPTITSAGNNSNMISMVFNTQPILDKTNQELRAKFSILPTNNVVIGTTQEPWTVSIEVIEGSDTRRTYTKTLTIGATLVPGKIHKITLPKFAPESAWNPIGGSWISSMYDYGNIYLTEFSIPGAWYAGAPTKDGYQATDDISTLWSKGVRAFAVECRSGSNSVMISGTGNNTGGTYWGGTNLRSTIQSIARQVLNTEEFAVLVLSYADGGKGGHRQQDYEYFINGIAKEISSANVSNIHSSAITANTTVNEVKGKLIIKINVDNRIPIGSYKGGMNALLSYTPLLQQLKPENGQTSIDYSLPLFSSLYWETWTDDYKKLANSYNSDNFIWCFSSANRTHTDGNGSYDIPTYAQRQAALRAMIERSKEISASSEHNVWFYFNAGGTQTTSSTDESTSATTFAQKMNPWLYKVINLKSNGGTDTDGIFGAPGTVMQSDPSPLGIVMFNQCTGADDVYYGERIINAIIQMNNKFDLKRKGYVGGASVGVDSWDIELL